VYSVRAVAQPPRGRRAYGRPGAAPAGTRGWNAAGVPGYAAAVGPYREADASERFEVAAREGLARLELGPRWFRLDMGERLMLSVAEDFATVVKMQRRKRRKQRSLRLGEARLLMARGVPTNDIGIWYVGAGGVAERLIGLRPPELLDDDAMRAWHMVDRMAQRLRVVLAPHGHGVERAIEVGQGADRVLIVDLGDGIEIYVRRLFREWPRRAMTVYRDGTVALVLKKGERRIQCRSRYGVTVIGDYIRFADPTGEDLGALSVPWVTPEDRRFLVQLIGQLIDPLGPLGSLGPLGPMGPMGQLGSIGSFGLLGTAGAVQPFGEMASRAPMAQAETAGPLEPVEAEESAGSAGSVGPVDTAEPEGVR
jgi:hypothetical protein